MTFDLEKYEEAIMADDESRRVSAGLELAEKVAHMEPEVLEQFGQQIVDLLLESLRRTDWEFRNLISNALTILGQFDFIAKSTWFWKKLISTYTDVDAGLRSTAMDLLKELGRSDYSLEILEPLIEGLQNPDKDMRILSANTLGRIQAREVLPMLIQALDDDNMNVVYNVVECLGNIGDRRAVPALMALLTDETDEWVHAATFEALGKIGDQRVVELLLSLIEKEFVVDPLINALGSLGDSRALPTLITYLKEEDRDIRELAIKALVSIWDEVESIAQFTGVAYELNATTTILAKYLTANMKNRLISDMNDASMPDDVREDCAVLLSCVGYQKALAPIAQLLEVYPLSKKIIYALGQYRKRAFPFVTPYSTHADFRVRQSVGLYLQHLVQQTDGFDSQIANNLLQLIKDENPILRQIAFEALGEFKHSSTISTLLSLLKTEPETFGEAIVAILAAFPKRSVWNAIQRQCNLEDTTTLPYLLKLIGHSSGQLGELKKFFKHPDPLVQEASLLAVGATGHPDGVPLLLPFIMSRQNSAARCAAAQSLQCLIEGHQKALPRPRNVFDALFVMLNTFRNEEELTAVALALGAFCRIGFEGISDVNVAVVRGRLLDLLASVSSETTVHLLCALHGFVDMSSFERIRELRALNSLEIQKQVAALYGQLDLDLRVVADVADMISHAEYSARRFWILAAGQLQAVELTDMLVPLLADQEFRAEAFEALTMMGPVGLPRLAQWIHHEDPRIQKMTALVLSKISQDHLDPFCLVPSHAARGSR